LEPNIPETKSVGPLTLRLPFDLLKPENFEGCEHFLGFDAKEAERKLQNGYLKSEDIELLSLYTKKVKEIQQLRFNLNLDQDFQFKKGNKTVSYLKNR
tara:strand:- start:58 stop:351 length:294 start_codon:yes stop_codon:yes gene_type:complete